MRFEKDSSNPATFLFALVACLAGVASVSCGAKSGLLDLEGEDGAGAFAGSGDGGNGGAGASGASGGDGGGGGVPTCGAIGASCTSEGDCCEGICAGGVCEIPPPACASDLGPVALVTGLVDPYAMGGDATSLFVGQLDTNKALLRLPKAGGAAVNLVESVDYTEYMVVQEQTVFFSTDGSVNSVPSEGGAVTVLTGAFGAAGLAVTKDRIFLAEYFAERLVAIDRATLEKEVLQEGASGIYRVAVAQGDVFFTSFFAGVFRHDLATGELSVVGEELGSPRALLAFHDDLYFTVPASQTIHRLNAGASAPTLVADLSSFGVYVEALVTDGAHLYTTVLSGDETGLVVRVPLGGGTPEVVTDQAGSSPSALVVDDDCVYWTERNEGVVYRTHKAPSPAP